MGGTGWLYLSRRPFETLGFPRGLPTIGLPRLTWVALKVLPAVVAGLMVLLSVLSLAFRFRAGQRPGDRAC